MKTRVKGYRDAGVCESPANQGGTAKQPSPLTLGGGGFFVFHRNITLGGNSIEKVWRERPAGDVFGLL